MMYTSTRGAMSLVIKCASVCLLLAALVLGGCSSCKEFEEQILQMDAQIADLQHQVADKESAIAECNQLADDIRANLQACEAEKAILVEQLEEVVMIRIPNQLLFHSSSDQVMDTMVPTLEAIAAAVREHPTWDVYVEGYTDSKKIMEEWHDKWPTNWELGAFRAAAVTRYLTNDLDLAAERFAVVSYGPFRPFDSNDTPEGRANNRVVQIVLHKAER
ncbi:MAG: OmpA family protein [bacterium]